MTELEKLKHLLNHWREHNDSHVKTYSDWAQKADSWGEKALANILHEIAGESKKLKELFNEAINII